MRFSTAVPPPGGRRAGSASGGIASMHAQLTAAKWVSGVSLSPRRTTSEAPQRASCEARGWMKSQAPSGRRTAPSPSAPSGVQVRRVTSPPRAVALAYAAAARVAEDFGASDLGHEPDDTMADSFEEGPLIHEDLAWRSALEISALVRDKQLSPVELTAALLARIEAINPRLNAYCLVAADFARAAAKEAEIAVMKREPLGPLHGVPVSLKDMFYTRGLRTTGGSRLFADLIPEEDAVPVGRLRAAGAVILGKTNTSEFGHKALTDNLLFGPTRNPWDPERTPGGSSGGRRRRRWPRGWARSASEPTVVARCGFPPRSAAWSDSSRPTGASRRAWAFRAGITSATSGR